MRNTPKGYRDTHHCIGGFNVCILDMDGGVSIKMTELLLNKYRYLLYCTKRHTAEKNRFRLIMPISHKLKLNENDYKQFMQNVYNFLPFELDEQTNNRSRKWLTNAGKYSYHEGELFDALPFIPHTKEANKRKEIYIKYSNLTNLERWVVTNANDMGRNNTLLRYAYVCVDLGQDYNSVRTNTMNLNGKLDKPLDEQEIDSSIMQSVAKKVITRDSK